MPQNQPIVLIITGMHRSGTSLVARYLQQCGLHIGERILNPDIGNPLGYYEDIEILQFHKDILVKLGVDAFLTDETKLPLRIDDTDQKRAHELVYSKSVKSQWGWKEPRTTLFLDFWDKILNNARYLFLFRHPLLVVDSLVRRGTDPHIVKKPIIGLKAWRIYNQEILRFWNSHRDKAVICEIDDVIRSAEHLCKYLINKFDISLVPTPFERVFVKQVFHKQYSYRVRWLNILHPIEYRRCMRLYYNLKAVAWKPVI